MSKYKNNNLQLNDINNKLLSLEKKVSKILNILNFLTNKINDMHNDIFTISPNSTFENISPISSPIKINKKITRQYSDNSDNSNIYNYSSPELSPRINNYSVKAVKAPTYHKVNKTHFLPDIKRKSLH
jgi:hypothetical protein